MPKLRKGTYTKQALAAEKKPPTGAEEKQVAGSGYVEGADKSLMGDRDYAVLQQYKRNWKESSEKGDSAGMAAAHDAAENIRAKYGYSGGQDGSEYVKTGVRTPVPDYGSRYSQQIEELSAAAASRPEFEYIPEEDLLYEEYAKLYGENGKRAMDDTLARVSARTGGLASSYAAQAAQQEYENYMSQLDAMLPELYSAAYGRYRDETEDIYDLLKMYQELESSDYGRYQDELDRYAADRSFEYNKQKDERELEYNRQQAEREDARDRLYYLLAKQGGSLGDEGVAELVAASGLTVPELNAYMREYWQTQAEAAAKAASKSGSSGRSSSGSSGSGTQEGSFSAMLAALPQGMDDEQAEFWLKDSYSGIKQADIKTVLAAYKKAESERSLNELSADIEGLSLVTRGNKGNTGNGGYRYKGRQYFDYDEVYKAAYKDIESLYDMGRISMGQASSLKDALKEKLAGM